MQGDGSNPKVRFILYSSPEFVIVIFLCVFPLSEPKPSMVLTTSIPEVTEPNTTCLPSSQVVFAVQMKNWDPFVFLPALAMDRIPDPVCFRMKFSSSNLLP